LKAALQQFGVTTIPVLNNDPNWDIHKQYHDLFYPNDPNVGGPGVPDIYVVDKDLNICGNHAGLTLPANQDKKEINQLLMNCGATQLTVANPLPYWFKVLFQIFGVAIDQGAPDIVPGGRSIPIDPWEPIRRLTREKRDILISLAMSELTNELTDNKISQELEMNLYRSIENSAKRLQTKLRILNTKIEKNWVTFEDTKDKPS
jgi:hypothetical protein